ncbi:MAG: translation initiation factor IF-2 [Treponema sp.]|uniref:translation initiation factor IF-2 n=1 Tax=Treponema sp. TaxID=166 RepID=UPI003FA27886
MTEELEKKTKIRVHKKQPEHTSSTGGASTVSADAAAAEKRKVVVKKKSPPSKSEGQASVKISVKTVPVPTSPVAKQSSAPAKTVAESTSAAVQTESVPVKKVSSISELSPQRPNVKQGNLAGRPRGGKFQGRGGRSYGEGERSFKEGGRSYSDGGFTGAQAREGYQNRNDRGTSGQGGRGGYTGRGGRDGARDGSREGGRDFRAGGAQGGRGGFTARTGGEGRTSGGRAGFVPRQGYSAPASPMPEAKKTPSKKTFTKKKTVYSRKDREEDLQDKLFNQKKKQITKANVVPEKIEIMETVSVSDLAKKMNLKASEIIAKLMSMGMMVSITQSIDSDTATLVASEYNCDVKVVSLYEETVIATEEDSEDAMAPRPPVVTIMGHVDHGKTKTLDAIRSTNVVATEFGGITQHIGAYMVETPKGRITFLDTPGHEAFTMMRARGAKVTDIVILVVAADDGVMPQTVEAINHAKDADVPIVVAVNKIDKPEANPDRVMTQLSDMGLMPEEWGGQTQFVKISALKKEGLDELLDAVLLQAEILELKANRTCRAEGKVIESRIDHGRGVVATIIVERGILRTGDPYVAGVYSGRVRAIFNDRGQKIEEATPSMPVEILGLEAMPNAGDPFQVTETEREARAVSLKRQELKRFEDAKNIKKVTLDNLYDTIDEGEVMELKVIVKADLQGSAEALKESLEKLSTRDIRLVVIHSSAGAINESDVMLAAADSNAIIIGFNVRPTPKAKVLAEQEKVDIRKYNIIYKAVEEITLAMEGMLKPDVKEEVIGMLEVRDTFKVPKVGLIAGSYVTQGLIKRTSSVNVIRDGIVIYTGKVSSLKHFKDDAKEIKSGFECGVGIDQWQDIKVGDQLEVFEYVEVARKLGDSEPAAKKGGKASKNAKGDTGDTDSEVQN